MLQILRRVHIERDWYVSVVRDARTLQSFAVYETEGDPRDTVCRECNHGTRCAHARIVRQAAEAVIAARSQSSMGVQP